MITKAAYIIFLLFLLAEQMTTTPQIFNEAYEFCRYEIDGDQVQLPDKHWTVENSKFAVHFSLCSNSARVHTTCKKPTSSCLIQKRSKLIVDLGTAFVPDDSGDLNFKSQNGSPCPGNPSKNYTLTVYLECTSSLRAPRVLATDDCEYEAHITSPKCAPKCTGLLQDAYLLDLRKFPKDIQVHSDGRRFSITLCGGSTTCGDPTVSTCEIRRDNTIVPLARTESQLINYDLSKNELTGRGRYKYTAKAFRKFQLLIKCNWKIAMAEAHYKKVQISGSKYQFEIESSFGCVKLPPDCFVISQDHLKYNVSALYRPSKPWELSTPHGKISLNICGPLRLNTISRSNECMDQYSQICEFKSTTNEYINRGSIMEPFEVDENGPKVRFLSGSVCKDNTKLYETEIKFQCYRTEQGPVYVTYKDCVTTLIWKTPQACPIDSYRGSNCVVANAYGNWNLQNLQSLSDRTYPLSQTTTLTYNLCGPLNRTCNGYSNVSFCLRNQKREHVIGWNNEDLLSENGALTLELNGPMCLNNRSLAKVDITFVCDYQVPSPPSQFYIVEDNCRFNVTVYTASACLTKTYFPKCYYNGSNQASCYDLSTLTMKSRNYIVQDPTEPNTEYILNVCGPLISSPTSLCRGQTMMCRHNRNELDPNLRFQPIGGIASPQLANNSLIIEAAMGAYCPGFGHYMSIIMFECSSRDEAPRFLQKDKCLYRFLWRTVHACSKNNMKCQIPNSNSRFNSHLSAIAEKHLNITSENDTKLLVDFCKDYYTRCNISTENNLCENRTLKRTLFDKEDKTYLVLGLSERCSSSSTYIGKIIIQLVCDQMAKNDHLEEMPRTNCTLNLQLRTNLACYEQNNTDKNKQKVNKMQKVTTEDLLENETYLSHKYTSSGTVLTQQASKECTIVNQYTSYQFNLSQIEPHMVTFGNNDYHINTRRNFPGCLGLLCRNNAPVIPFLEKCPKILYNYTGSYVKLQFEKDDYCPEESNIYEIWLKCADLSQGPAEPKFSVDVCKIIVQYEIPEACSLLSKNHNYESNSSAIIGGICGTILLSVGLVLIACIIRRKYNCFKSNSYGTIPLVHSKRSVPVYMKDADC